MNRIPLRSALIGGLAVLAALTAGGIALAGEDRPPTSGSAPASGSVDGSVTTPGEGPVAQTPDGGNCPGEGGGASQGESDTPAAGL